MTDDQYDVVVAGAGLAGCTAAVLLARQGLSVALVEAHRDPGHHKRDCTHYIQAGGPPVLQRLGLLEQVEAAGAVPNRTAVWTRWGWIVPPDGTPAGLNVRRSTLDPMLRGLAAGTAGVRFLSGARVRGLLRDGDRTTGVVVADDTGERRLGARLVVGADGRTSSVAELAGLHGTEKGHGRFIYFASFSGVRLSTGRRSQMWILDPDIAYAFPNDGGVTVLAAALTADKLNEFRADVDGNLVRLFGGLPDAPDLADARRVSPTVGVLHYPNRRRPATAPGLALAGDAALTSDYVWGVGCGWALQSAEWLADAVGPTLVRGGDLDRALAAYRRRHRRALAGHHALIVDGASGRPLNALERLMFSAAARDEAMAIHFARFGTRVIPPSRFLAPRPVLRAVRVNLAHRRSRGAAVPLPRSGAHDTTRASAPAPAPAPGRPSA